MPEVSSHPTAQALALFGHGKLSEAQAATVAAHLETCADCRSAVAGLPADSFLGKVRAAKPGGSSVPPAASPARPGIAPSVLGKPTVPPAPPANVPPELANHSKFRIVRELGRGGMGVIYLAEHRVLEKLVALKVISPAVLDNPDALARFHAEVKAAGKLDHPNIARAHDADQAGDLHFLVMEFVEGLSLAQVVEKKGPLPVAHACHYARQAALGLQHAAEKGMVHRDIKPQNLMLAPKNVVKVLDFGLARLRSERKGAVGLTQADAFMGTPEYVAPEQATDARTADTRADIYSLGCTLYALLTGRPPFLEDTLVKLVLAHIEKEPLPLHELRPDVPAELSAVVARMLAKDPAQRYQQPVEVAQALVPFIKAGGKAGVAGGASLPPGVAAAGRGTLVGGDTSRVRGLGKAVTQLPAQGPGSAEEKGPQLGGVADAPVPATKKGKKQHGAAKPAPAAWWKRPAVLAGAAAAILALLLVGLWAGGVFKVKTKDGVLVVEVNEPNLDVYVDAEKVTVTWDDGGKKAEIRVKPGTHKIEVKKEGFTTYGEEVEIEVGTRRILTARLTRREPPPEKPAEGDGFVPLFNGKDLTGWHVVRGDADDWQVEQGELSFTGTGWEHRSFLVSDKEYTDYAIHFEFQADDKGFAGFTVRSLPGRGADDIPGGQIWIRADKRAGRFTWARGGDYLSPNPKPQLQPPENWNRMEVRLHGRRLRVLVNGRQVQNLNLDQVPERPITQPYLKRSQGTIEFTRLEGTVRLRNLEWCDLSNTPPPTDPVSPSKIVTYPRGRQAVGLGDGDWLREGDELVQTGLNPNVRLFFGDVEWTDYDFSCDAMRLEGPNGFDFIVRATDKYNYLLLGVGAWNNTKHAWTSVNENVFADFKGWRDAGVDANKWYPVRVSVRGPRCQCFLDNEPEPIFDFIDRNHLRGAVGFLTWETKVRFRNIKVTDPDGKVLWERVPKLDAIESGK